MPRNISIIAIIGLVGCLTLSMIMQHLLKSQKEQSTPGVILEVKELFGARLDGPPSLEMEDRDGEVVALLTITPVTGLSKSRLAKDVGQYVWRRLVEEPRPARMEVICRDPLGGEDEMFPVQAPYVNTRRSDPAKSPAKPRR